MKFRITHTQLDVPYYWAGAGWHHNPAHAALYDTQDEAQAELDGAHLIMTEEAFQGSSIEEVPEPPAETDNAAT